MKHSIKKIKMQSGRGSTQMVVKKLLANFLLTGKMTITQRNANVLKSTIERVVEKAKIVSEANKNFLLRHFTQKKFINVLFDQVGPALKNTVGGYVRITKLATRMSDGASVATIEWAHPVVIEWEKKEVVVEQPKEKKVAKLTK